MSKTATCLCTLAICVSAQAQYRLTRPVRGVWLRPPTTISELNSVLQNLTGAGITDLYLETFYWGISTGRQGVFNARFSFDYLAQAIPAAAKYGIRLHAWVESGYWQYGTTGGYNFTANPEWRVFNVSTTAIGGDNTGIGQVFANLTIPGVQQKLRNYTAELATYPGLWGIQTDYHRMPVDNSTSDNYPAPWSYDTYSQTAFKAIYGQSADILTKAARTSHQYWNQFLAYRRNGISEAANQMHLGITGVSNDVVFSGAVFANANNSGEISKCQDWPTWCANGYVDQVVPMAYGPTTTSIANDVTTALSFAGSKRVLAGLATTGSSSHPLVGDQLAAVTSAGVEDFVIFDAPSISDSISQTSINNWRGAAKKHKVDFNNNSRIDFGDWQSFVAIYGGSPVAVNGSNARFDINSNGTIDSGDLVLVKEAFRKDRLGENGILSDSDRAAFNTAFTGPGLNSVNKSLYDFDLDGDVDEIDRSILEMLGAGGSTVFLQVSLQDSSLPASQNYTIEVRNAGQSTVLTSWNLTASSAGVVAVPLPSSGTYDVSVKFSHWLRKKVTLAASGSDQTASLNLTNGDCNNDNVVDLSDYTVVVIAFNTAPAQPGWNINADLNSDSIVDLTDYTVLVSNFNASGD